MTVIELKKMLNKYPDNMIVIVDRYSDYSIIEEGDLEVVEGVLQSGYVMYPHETMNKDYKIDKFLHLG